MKNGRPQAKDISDLPILRLLNSRRGKWFHWHGENRDLEQTFPPTTPKNLMLAKMASMIRRGLVSGCACGCRGEFEITETGIKALTANQDHAIDSHRRILPVVTGAPSQGGK